MVFLVPFINKLTLWKILIAFSKNPVLCSMIVTVYRVEFTSWKTLVTFLCSLNCGITTFSLNHMAPNGSHASGVIINISLTKWLPVWTRNPLGTGRKFNVHKTFRRGPGRILNVLGTFSLCPVSRGKQVRSWQHSSSLMNGKIFAKRLGERDKN